MRWHVFSFAAAIALSPLYTSAATQDVTILNRTGYPIQSIYVMELGGTDWGDDVMGRDTLRDGERVKITFDRRTEACRWNVMVKYRDATQAVWNDLNLCRMAELSLLYDHRTDVTLARGK